MPPLNKQSLVGKKGWSFYFLGWANNFSLYKQTFVVKCFRRPQTWMDFLNGLTKERCSRGLAHVEDID
jgi:hypothetical protein